MSSTSSSYSKKHPIYRGIRCRGEKWVSEIREPRKSNRIWLGTFLTPDMAAAAYDVASIALKGNKAILNFPNLVHKYPIPASSSPDDIRNAATTAAHLFIKRVVQDDHDQPHQLLFGQYHNDQMTSTFTTSIDQQEFVDEEALFSMPNLLVDMAQGLLLSPPRLNLNPQPSSESQEYISDGCESLWS